MKDYDIAQFDFNKNARTISIKCCVKPQQRATKKLQSRQSTNCKPQLVNKSILISNCTIMSYSCRLSAILTHECKHCIRNLLRESGIGDYPPIRLLSQGLDQQVMTNLFKLRIAWEATCVIAKMLAICVCVHANVFHLSTSDQTTVAVTCHISVIVINNTTRHFLTTIKTHQSRYTLRLKSLFNKLSLKSIMNWLWMYKTFTIKMQSSSVSAWLNFEITLTSRHNKS